MSIQVALQVQVTELVTDVWWRRESRKRMTSCMIPEVLGCGRTSHAPFLLTAMLPAGLSFALFTFLTTATLGRASASQIPLGESHTSDAHFANLEPRHAHAISTSGRVVFTDLVGQDIPMDLASETHSIPTRPLRIHRPRSPSSITQSRARRRRAPSVPTSLLSLDDLGGGWDEDEVPGPDVSKRETLLLLAKMTNNAYLRHPNNTQWYDLGSDWSVVRVVHSACILDRSLTGCSIGQSYPVGWEPDADGFRGHVFATPDNSTVVLAIKGTLSPLNAILATSILMPMPRNICALFGRRRTYYCERQAQRQPFV